MAMVDYGALVKKNGILLPHTNFFNNYSTLNGGDVEGSYNKDEDESIREFTFNDKNSPYRFRSVINNYMAVVGDDKFLVATYKTGVMIFDAKQDLGGYSLEECKFAHTLKNDYADIKIKKLDTDFVGTASFRYNNDNYEILFGYGVDHPNFLFSKKAVVYMSAKTLRKVRRWVKSGLMK